METILTIDFDIIMGPSIELYNNAIGINQNTIQSLSNMNHLLEYANADLKIYRKLTDYLLALLPIIGKENIHIIREHHHAVNFINNPCKVINIDHHHDLGYSNLTDLSCGNWAFKLIENDIIKQYTWIRNNTSETNGLAKPETKELTENKNVVINDLLVTNTLLTALPTPSKVIICLSPQWIPQQFIPLFNLWEDLVDQYPESK